MASGMLYSATSPLVTVSLAPTGLGPALQNLCEIRAAPNVSLEITLIRITFVPWISANGVDQPGYAQVAIATLTATGFGGTNVPPAASHPRNTVPAVTRFVSCVTSPGTIGATLIATNEAVDARNLPYTYTQRIPISGGGMLAVIVTPLVPLITATMTIEVLFEEF